MNDLLALKPMQLVALREVANIGAGHAATALSLGIRRALSLLLSKRTRASGAGHLHGIDPRKY